MLFWRFKGFHLQYATLGKNAPLRAASLLIGMKMHQWNQQIQPKTVISVAPWESCCTKSLFTSVVDHAFSSFCSVRPAVLHQGTALNQKSGLRTWRKLEGNWKTCIGCNWNSVFGCVCNLARIKQFSCVWGIFEYLNLLLVFTHWV